MTDGCQVCAQDHWVFVCAILSLSHTHKLGVVNILTNSILKGSSLSPETPVFKESSSWSQQQTLVGKQQDGCNHAALQGGNAASHNLFLWPMFGLQLWPLVWELNNELHQRFPNWAVATQKAMETSQGSGRMFIKNPPPYTMYRIVGLIGSCSQWPSVIKETSSWNSLTTELHPYTQVIMESKCLRQT